MTPAAPITRRHTLVYGASAYGKGLFIAGMQFVWLFFMTDVLEIPPAIAGLILLVPLVWDGVVDPLIGYLADRTRTRWGKYRPYLIFASPVVAVFFALAFVRPPFGPEATIAWAFVTGMLFRSAYAAIEVPHNAIMALGTRDSKLRATLAGLKVLFNGLAGLTVALAIAPILKGANVDAEAQGFFVAAAVGGAVAVPLMWLCAAVFRDVDRPTSTDAAPPVTSLRSYVGGLVGDRSVFIVFGVWIVTMMTLPTFSKSLIYFAKYDLGDETWASTALVTMTVGQTLAAPLFAWLAQRFEKARLAQIGQALSVVVLMVLLTTHSTDRIFLGVLVALEGVAIGGSMSIALSMVPDLVEANELRTGRRVEAGVFGAFMLSNKVAQGLGIGLFGVLLGASGYVANVAQSEETLRSMRMIMTVLPIVGSLAAIAILAFYKLNYAEHRRVSEAIAARGPS